MNYTHGKYQFAFLAYHMLALVTANRELIAPFEQKIQAALARVWGEEGSRCSKARAMKSGFVVYIDEFGDEGFVFQAEVTGEEPRRGVAMR